MPRKTIFSTNFSHDKIQRQDGEGRFILRLTFAKPIRVRSSNQCNFFLPVRRSTFVFFCKFWSVFAVVVCCGGQNGVLFVCYFFVTFLVFVAVFCIQICTRFGFLVVFFFWFYFFLQI